MNSIIRWIVGVGVIWLIVTTSLTAYIATHPIENEKNNILPAISMKLIDAGENLGHFIAPVLQLALIIMILIAAAERFGFTLETKNWSGFAALGAANNVQAFIAVTVISGVVIAALVGLDSQGVLKDLALVVVGFYFGTRRRQNEIEDAVAAGAAAGTAAQAAPPAPDSTR